MHAIIMIWKMQSGQSSLWTVICRIFFYI